MAQREQRDLLHQRDERQTEKYKNHLIAEAETHRGKELFNIIMELFENHPDFIRESVENGTLIPLFDKALSEMNPLELAELSMTNTDLQELVIQEVFLAKEDQLYRYGKRNSVKGNWSDKLYSLVGNVNGSAILNNVTNHLGEPVRTKSDTIYKSAEAQEILTEHSSFLEEKPGTTVATVMAEVADAIYNITQLMILDKKNVHHYEEYLDAIATIYQVPKAVLNALVLAKYHFRMYKSTNGRNAYEDEDAVIRVIIQNYIPVLEDGAQAIKAINTAFGFFDQMFANIRLILRFNLQQLKLQEFIYEATAQIGEDVENQEKIE